MSVALASGTLMNAYLQHDVQKVNRLVCDSGGVNCSHCRLLHLQSLLEPLPEASLLSLQLDLYSSIMRGLVGRQRPTESAVRGKVG